MQIINKNSPAFYIIYPLIVFIFFFSNAKGQLIENAGLKNTVLAIQTAGKKMPVEKVYLQFDQPHYSLGDTIRFKAYLLNADFLTLSTRSGLLYIELDDKNNKSIKRILVPVVKGISWGGIALNESTIPEGDYTIRAYTNWMRNFGEDYVFKKSFYISPVITRSLLVSTAFKLVNNELRASLQFTNLDKRPLKNQQMQFLVTDEKKTLYQTDMATSADGKADISFTLSNNTDIKQLAILATEVTSIERRSVYIPVNISRLENTGLKFMPEGGNLVAGLPTLIGFKATGEDGRGITIAGNIYNSKQHQVATFESLHAGIGSFELTPQAGETYTAKIGLPGSASKSYPLPKVNTTGTTLKITSKGNDSLELTLSDSQRASGANSYYLIGQSRGVVCYAELINFKDLIIKKTIAKQLFPTGVGRFTLLNSEDQALNERLIFIGHNDDLHINISSNKPAYTTRDSIAISLQVTDKSGNPVNGSFSAAVTDNSQLKPDSLATNMVNYLQLTSDLKDEVEYPGYYFENNDNERIKALDNLLLTQSAAGYSWKDVFEPNIKPPEYAAEPEYTIQGRVTNILNKPVANSQILLLSKKPAMVLASLTDNNGQFVFKGFMPVDTAVFLLEAKNKNGKNSNVGIGMNVFKQPVFTETTERQNPWYVNTDTTLLGNTIEQIAKRNQKEALKISSRQLKEVQIRDTKIINGSKNLNGPGESDQALDKDDLEKAGKMTLRQLLEQKIKGFTQGDVPYPPDNQGRTHPGDPKYRISYKILDKEIRFVFDGQNLDYYYPPDPITGASRGQRTKDMYNSLSYDWKRFVDFYLDYYTAEDITGIEVMYSPAYNSQYANKYLSIREASSAGVTEKYAYIEITTRAGQGPFLKKTPGTYVYKPLPVTLSKPFYRPRYNARNATIGLGTDLRSTIHWAPGIVTDPSGKATISFYSADTPGSYNLVIEGTDLNGQPGYQTKKIKINPQ